MIISYLPRNTVILVAIALASFISPKLLYSQETKPSFYLYGNCNILSEDKSINDLLEEVNPSHENEQGGAEIDIPKNIAKKEIRPLVNDMIYVFSNSRFIGFGKVKKVFLYNNAISDWELHYKKDFKILPGVTQGKKSNIDPIDVGFDKLIDVKKLGALNVDNVDFVKNNKLNENEIKILEEKISVELKVNQQATPHPARAMKGQKAFKAFNEKVAGGLWKPDYLYPGWTVNSSLQFSIKFEAQNYKIAIFKCPTNNTAHSFVVCQTLKGLYFYPIDQDNTGCHFDQIINWFGDFYICFYNNGVGGYSKIIYEIKETGLTPYAVGGVSFD